MITVTRSASPPRTLPLAVVAAAGPFSTDASVAALPDTAAALHTSPATAALSVTTCIVGLAVGMTLSGPISDARGRRPLLLGGAALYLLFSVVCALAPSAGVLIVARLAQGLAAGAAAPIGRAVLTDRFAGAELARRLGTLTAVALLAPVVAPAVGGVLLDLGGWRAVFWLMAAVGGAMLISAAVTPETLEALDADGPRPLIGVRALTHRITDLLTDRTYLRPLVVQCLAIAGLFVYVGGSSFVLQRGAGVSPGTYSAIFATDAGAMAAACFGFRFAVARVGVRRLRTVGLLVSVGAAGLLAVLTAALQYLPLGVTWALLALVLAGLGLTVPASAVLSQEAGARSAGTAASVFNGVGYLVAAAVTPLTGAIDATSLLTMTALMAVFLAGALLAALRRPRGENHDDGTGS